MLPSMYSGWLLILRSTFLSAGDYAPVISCWSGGPGVMIT